MGDKQQQSHFMHVLLQKEQECEKELEALETESSEELEASWFGSTTFLMTCSVLPIKYTSTLSVLTWLNLSQS